MIFPELANSIATALTLIDYAIKFMRFLSPPTRIALQEAEDQLSRSHRISYKQAQDVLMEALRAHVPTGEIEAVSQDIRHAIEVMQPMIEVLEESRLKGVYPKYGLAVDLVAKGTYEKLASWRCFQAWAHEFEMVMDPPHVLPMPHTEASIRECKALMKQVRWFANHGKLFIVDPKELYENRIYDVAYLCFTNRIAFIQKRIYVSALSFGDNAVRVINKLTTKTQHGCTVVISGSESSATYRLTYQDLALMVGGLLNDVVYYSRIIRGEIDAGQSIVGGLKDIFN
jgi:hypothetical protein